MDSEVLLRNAFYVCSAAALIFLAEALYLGLIAPIRNKRNINRRLRTQATGLSGEQAMLRIKAERGILDRDVKMMRGLRKLLVQTGLRLTMGRFAMVLAADMLGAIVLLRFVTPLPLMVCVLLGAVLGFLVPVQALKYVRTRRQRTFASQLPDALDVVVRSLRSGHPVQIALGLVGREMPDPIGSEFGITLDEMTYGIEMPRALQNLSARIGLPDLSLLVTAVTLQNMSGGNLSQVLDNLSRILRERFQLRRKVRSISAEGRFSAYGLTVLPILIALAIFVENPRYYTDVWHQPVFQITMVGLIVWQFIGDLIMFKMINFKF